MREKRKGIKKKKYYSADEIREMILKEGKLPRTGNQKGKRYSFGKKKREMKLKLK